MQYLMGTSQKANSLLGRGPGDVRDIVVAFAARPAGSMLADRLTGPWPSNGTTTLMLTMEKPKTFQHRANILSVLE